METLIGSSLSTRLYIEQASEVEPAADAAQCPNGPATHAFQQPPSSFSVLFFLTRFTLAVPIFSWLLATILAFFVFVCFSWFSFCLSKADADRRLPWTAEKGKMRTVTALPIFERSPRGAEP
jgi:hypothetical protein